jgi:hypothetical protein
MAKAYLIKQSGGSFLPAFDTDYETMKKIKTGETIQVTYVKPRNIGHHRKFFALINMVFENQEVYTNAKHLRKELTKAAGYYDTYTNHKGITCYEAQSISFASMDQTDFDDLYQRFLDKVEEIFHFDSELVNENIEKFY